MVEEILNSFVLEIIWDVAIAICSIFMFHKMNIDAWAAIIPVYGTWRLFDKIWGRGWVVLILFIAAMIYFPIAATIIRWATYFMVFRGFGKSVLFSILGAIFTPIGIIICAFDSSTFCG